MPLNIPYLRTPFQDLGTTVDSLPHFRDCGRLGMRTANCLEAFGYRAGEEKCADLIADFNECRHRTKQYERVLAMREERYRQVRAGERSKADKFAPEPRAEVIRLRPVFLTENVSQGMRTEILSIGVPNLRGGMSSLRAEWRREDMNQILVLSVCLVVPFFMPLIATFFGEFFDRYEHLNVSSAHIAALILARGGSKGIVLKNLVKIGNVTLVTRALTTITNFGKFNSVWVSTDSRLIEEESLKTNGVQVHRRSPETATDTASSLVAVLEFLTKHEEIDVIALIQCTSPFLKISYLNKAYNLLHGGHHSVFSLTRQHKLRWRIAPQGLQPDNFQLNSRPRRQDWDGELVENGMFYFNFREIIQKENLLQGGRRSAFVEIPQRDSLEIDSEFDLKLARYLAKTEQHGGDRKKSSSPEKKVMAIQNKSSSEK